jgi:hypothetical protein
LSTRKRRGSPQRRKRWRKSSWTAATGTAEKVAWGENRGAEHGPRELIDVAQPGHLAATGQPLLVGGIDLPDVMGPGGRLALRVGLAASRGGGLPGGLEPALQGAAGGEGLARMAVLQEQAEQAATPGGVLLVEEDGLVVRGVGRRGPVGGVVAGAEGLRPVAAAALQQVLDGAQLEAEGSGDGRWRLTLERKAVPNLLSERQRQGHGNTWGKKE